MRTGHVLLLLALLNAVTSSCVVSAEQVMSTRERSAAKVLRLVSNNPQHSLALREQAKPRADDKKLPAVKPLPSLRDLGLNLDSSSVAKRNELESLSLQPWTPGRGAVGVKVEVTW
jgi:beta-xylosidase